VTAAGAADPVAPQVYLITDRHATEGRPLADVIVAALDGLTGIPLAAGAVAVQLRDKDLPVRDLLALARHLRDITAARGVRLFVNDRVDVALAAGADGVHLGGGALTVDDVRAIAPDLQIAVSTHAVAEVERRQADPRVSFVVFGPVFETPSKRAYGSPLGLSALRQACATGVAVVAVGGIDTDRAPACRAAGASGIAVIRAILGSPTPDRAMAGFFGAIEST
jgi:thiamine-phosphate pyrophosphorylase